MPPDINGSVGYRPHKSTLERWRQQGKIQMWKLGCQWMTTPEAVQRFAEESQVGHSVGDSRTPVKPITTAQKRKIDEWADKELAEAGI
ncbi:DUF1580 domain-containing protein [Aureliella helgolandensis]|uniref:Uncharacterized protein n=1 Tax=Aureliella helgolandensis TaxID=2527968 RepID=A0A518GFN5_9BACT|nr:DUF1580 domain-containing protein [Aureliella helgolandensis]QDV27380.1 hypothetical protein Q31a_57690 [Aureliella helgolandensis]